ncbi:hypothetical protein R50072_22980 [Simiduia litorea]
MAFGLLISFSSLSVGQGLSDEEALSLTADLVLLRYENSIDNCEHMGAKNMEQLYAALRQLGQLRQESVPVKSTRFIERAKSSYRLGLAGLPKPDVEKADHVALICERTHDKMAQLDAASFSRLVQNSMREYQMLFAQAK